MRPEGCDGIPGDRVVFEHRTQGTGHRAVVAPCYAIDGRHVPRRPNSTSGRAEDGMNSDVGSPAVGFALEDTTGTVHRLEQYRGHWLLMVFHRHLA